MKTRNTHKERSKQRTRTYIRTWNSLYRFGAEKGMRPNTKVYKHAPRAYTSVGRPRYLVLGFIISGARKAGVPLQRSRYSFPVAKICAQPRTFQCACIFVCVCVCVFVCVCVCVCVGLYHFGCEECRGAVAVLQIFISGGEDLPTAEDIPMCLHSFVYVRVGLRHFGCEERRALLLQ